jgi:hypothetical protein
MGEKRNVGTPEGKRPLGRFSRRKDDNIKMDLRDRTGVVLTGFIWLKTSADSCEHGNEPSGSIKCWVVLE